MNKKNAKAIIVEYTGRKPEEIKSIEVVADPQVEGTFAIRTKMDNENQDWLVTEYYSDMDVEKAAELLEECEFESWPPTSGSLQFFM